MFLRDSFEFCAYQLLHITRANHTATIRSHLLGFYAREHPSVDVVGADQSRANSIVAVDLRGKDRNDLS